MFVSRKVVCKRTVRRRAWAETRRLLTSIRQYDRPVSDGLCPAAGSSSFPVSSNFAVDDDVGVSSGGSSSESGLLMDLGCYVTDSDNINFTSDSDTDFSVLPNRSSRDELKENLRKWALQSRIPLVHVSSLLGILQPHFPELPKDARTLLHTDRNCSGVEDISNGKYYHFGVEKCVSQQLQKYTKLQELNELKLQINIDGMPLFKSSSECFWPVLGLLCPGMNLEPFVIGLWVGKSKPVDSNAYLEPFVKEMKTLMDFGVKLSEKLFKISILNFVCDTPARCFVRKTKGHCGYYGCDYCVQKGQYYMNRMTFPEIYAERRTDDSFEQMVHADHHHGASILADLGIGMVTQCPLDYLHLVCLGVMKRMMSKWIGGPLSLRIGAQSTRLISDAISALKRNLPNEFVRKGRGLNELERWKATEFRTFLLYTGPVVLKRHITTHLYDNFMLLSISIYILCHPLFSHKYSGYAQELLEKFVEYTRSIYGQEMIVYNMHALIHLVPQVEKFGPLYNFSSFPFENYLQVIKRLIRKPKSPLQQAVHRLQEMSHLPSERNSEIHQKVFMSHDNGPLPPNVRRALVAGQYHKIWIRGMLFSTREPDNAILIGDQTYMIKNIMSLQDKSVRFVCQKFSKVDPFFTFPFNSLKIQIAVVGQTTRSYSVVDAHSDYGKVVLLPTQKGAHYVSIPML